VHTAVTALQGYWFDGKTSARVAAELRVDNAALCTVINMADGSLLHQQPVAEIKISSRLGNTSRFIYFSAGEKFETQDNAQVDTLLKLHKPSRFNTLAHQLESHSYFVLLTLIIVVSLSWAGVEYGLPAASKAIAYRLPASIMNATATQTLALLDKTHLAPTQLDKATQARIRQHFQPALQENAALHARVYFRAGGDIGPNAFALPDGSIVFTDEMVKLARSDDELVAVLAHELGHVKYRHGLRAAIQGSSLSFFVSMLTGDLSAASSALAALPVFLTTMSYSRDFEREADQNALEYLDAHHIDRHVFIDLMERVTYETHCDALLAEDRGVRVATDLSVLTKEQLAARKQQCDVLIAKHSHDKSIVMDYLASHPATEERLQKFRQSR
jgi:Zn-dependent protease with chaperone function